ncbi:hypothetical protein ACFWBH_19805 [Streptomyces sp. NPDC059999]|uniref:hypothetical protein n=1 Tax=Streptomyces sp. NPDC059999 TaxID=3347030 RepID=UPI0036CB9B8D
MDLYRGGDMGNNDDAGRPGVSDEAWERFVRESGVGGGAAPHEPSARARMVTERLRREDEARAAAERGRWRGRRARAARRAAEPEGWRTGPAWQGRDGGRTGDRRLKATAGIVFIAALALVVVRPELLIDRLTGENSERSGAQAAQPLPAESVRPTAAPSADPDRPTLKEPFRGSPALQWAEGANAIEVPEAKAVGGLSKERVAQALTLTKELLVASNIDPATLRGGRPEAALKLLEPLQEEGGRSLFARALDKPSEDASPTSLFSRFDPAEVRLVGEVVKVRGRMSFEAGDTDGEVRVRADYTFVYPLVKAAAGSDQVERTIVRRRMSLYVNDPVTFRVTPGTLQYGEHEEEFGNDSCGVHDGYLHPQFDRDKVSGDRPTGAAVDPYDRSKELADRPAGECGTLSRS